MPKLTKRVVDAATVGERQTLLWDSEVKGFGLRITPAGAKAYILNYRNAAGQVRRYTIGRHGSPWTADEARAKAVELLRRLAIGIDPLEAKAEGRAVVSVADLAELYLAEGPAEKPNKKASSWATDTSNLRRHIIPLLGHRPVKSLMAKDVARYQADVTAGKTAADIKTRKLGRAIVRGGRGTAARSTAIFGAMLAFAVRRGLIPSNPAIGVAIGKGEKKERFLLDREIMALADALEVMEAELAISRTMAAAIRLLMLSGCRKNEITSLQWSWVDFDRGCLRLPDSKTGAKVVPLASAALDLLASLPRTSQFVLPSNRSDQHIVGLQKAWSKLRVIATTLARQRAGAAGMPVDVAPDLTNLRLHDLRHTYASFAVSDGASLYLVGKVLGHRQSRTTEIYAHLHDDPVRAIADRTGARIASAMRKGAERHR